MGMPVLLIDRDQWGLATSAKESVSVTLMSGETLVSSFDTLLCPSLTGLHILMNRDIQQMTELNLSDEISPPAVSTEEFSEIVPLSMKSEPSKVLSPTMSQVLERTGVSPYEAKIDRTDRKVISPLSFFSHPKSEDVKRAFSSSSGYCYSSHTKDASKKTSQIEAPKSPLKSPSLSTPRPFSLESPHIEFGLSRDIAHKLFSPSSLTSSLTSASTPPSPPTFEESLLVTVLSLFCMSAIDIPKMNESKPVSIKSLFQQTYNQTLIIHSAFVLDDINVSLYRDSSMDHLPLTL